MRKRVLQHYKAEAEVPEELNAVWGVGAALWVRSFAKAYSVLDSYAWSADIQPLMAILRGNRRLIHLDIMIIEYLLEFYLVGTRNHTGTGLSIDL